MKISTHTSLRKLIWSLSGAAKFKMQTCLKTGVYFGYSYLEIKSLYTIVGKKYTATKKSAEAVDWDFYLYICTYVRIRADCFHFQSDLID